MKKFLMRPILLKLIKNKIENMLFLFLKLCKKYFKQIPKNKLMLTNRKILHFQSLILITISNLGFGKGLYNRIQKISLSNLIINKYLILKR